MIWRRQGKFTYRVSSSRSWMPSLNRLSAVVTDTPRSFLQIVAHNLKLAANIDHMRDDTSNAPSGFARPPLYPSMGAAGSSGKEGSPYNLLYSSNSTELEFTAVTARSVSQAAPSA